MLAASFSRMSLRPQVLSSKANGVAAAPKVVAPVATRMVAQPAALVVENKLKTRKAAAKRYKITGSGKVLARHNGKQHMNEKKDKSRKKKLSKAFVVSDRDTKLNVIRNLPYAKVRCCGNK